MSKKKRPYLLVFNGKFLEHDSLLKLRTEIPEDEWTMMADQTAEFYLQLNAVHQSEIPLERDDRKSMRRLNRTLQFIAKIDPITYAQLDLKTRKDAYAKLVEAEIQNAQTAETKTTDSPAGTIVSRLD